MTPTPGQLVRLTRTIPTFGGKYPEGEVMRVRGELAKGTWALAEVNHPHKGIDGVKAEAFEACKAEAEAAVDALSLV